MMASIDRYIKSKNYGKSIARDKAFASSSDVLEGVARVLRQNGKGKRPNRASLSNADIQLLWDCGQLGCSNPGALIHTMWWNNCVVLGLRRRKVHHDMQMDDFEAKTDNSGREFISYAQGLSKTNPDRLNSKPRPVFPQNVHNRRGPLPREIIPPLRESSAS